MKGNNISIIILLIENIKIQKKLESIKYQQCSKINCEDKYKMYDDKIRNLTLRNQ